jgi:serine/threonine-protein kinase
MTWMPKGGQRWRKVLGDALSPGDVIDGKYRLERLVGTGGMGVVLEACHVELDARVAVKVLRPSQYDTDTARERFRREARAAFRITSEHVARIMDLGSFEGGGLYMVMEFLDGRDLCQLLVKNGRLPVGTAVGIILQVCEAVAEAHSLGIVHRDLKPENIFVCKRADGSPCAKVIDFGLAKVDEPRASLTGMNRGLGTPRYMSPEQWVSARDVGGGADIWALGVILFELVSGMSPFDDDDVNELCQAILAGPVPRASQAFPGVPKGIDDVIAKCLQKKPSQRYASAAELAADLLPFAQTTSATTSTMRPPAPSARWMMSDSDIDVPAAATQVEMPEPAVVEKTTLDNVEVAHAHEVLRAEVEEPPTVLLDNDDSSGEWVLPPEPLPLAPEVSRSPGVIKLGLAAAAIVSVGLVALAVTQDEPAPTVVEKSPPGAVQQTREQKHQAPVLLPPPAPLNEEPTSRPSTAVSESEPADVPPGEEMGAEDAPPRPAFRRRLPRDRRMATTSRMGFDAHSAAHTDPSIGKADLGAGR